MLLINPASEKFGGFMSRYVPVGVPVALGYISAYLEMSGIKCSIIDEELIDIGNGAWDLALDTIPNVGGPYISYIYNQDNRSIMLIGLVSNPGNDKMIYIKELELIFKDIK